MFILVSLDGIINNILSLLIDNTRPNVITPLNVYTESISVLFLLTITFKFKGIA